MEMKYEDGRADKQKDRHDPPLCFHSMHFAKNAWNVIYPSSPSPKAISVYVPFCSSLSVTRLPHIGITCNWHF